MKLNEIAILAEAVCTVSLTVHLYTEVSVLLTKSVNWNTVVADDGVPTDNTVPLT